MTTNGGDHPSLWPPVLGAEGCLFGSAAGLKADVIVKRAGIWRLCSECLAYS
jgi:hypothetical protein